MEAKKLENVSLEEYQLLERSTDTKYEYHDGTIFSMAGGTIEHGLITGNTYGAYSGPIDPPIPIWFDPPVPESLTP